MKTLNALLLSLVCLQLTASPVRASPDAPPDLPLPVASFGAAALPSGEVFVYGGHSGARHKYNNEDVHGDLFQWRPGAADWEKVSTDEPDQGASLLPTEGGVLRIGGMAARNAKDQKQDLWSSDTAAIFELASKTWKRLPNMPERRSSHDSVIADGKVYVVGGWAMIGGNDTEWHEHYLTLDLAKPEAGWQKHPQPFMRRAIAVQVVGTKLYAIGGMDSDNELLTDVSVLDMETGKWGAGPGLPKDKLAGFGFAALAHEGRLFASGAAGDLLELRGEQWTVVGRLQHPRYFHRFVAGGPGKIIALGGESKEGKKTPSEVIELPKADSVPLTP